MSRTCLLLLALALVPLAGCERDEIRSYTVPRPDDGVGTGDVRLLAAIVPAGDVTWFFKLTGRADVLAAVEPAWDGLIASLSRKDDGDLAWKVPDKWKEERGANPNRVATLRPEGVSKPEIAVSKLPSSGAALKPNLDRWRRIDLGLGPISGRAVPKVTREKNVNGLAVTLVDMRGPGVRDGGAAKMPAFHPPAKERKERKAPLKYAAPPEWREVPGGSGLTAASFTVGEGAQAARVLVTPLAGGMPGGLLGNVNRWRSEVRLPEITEAELKGTPIRDVRVAGAEAKYLDLQGKELRSLVVWLEHKGTTWFFKMLGPGDVVGKQKTNFESFVGSVTFPGDANE